MAEAGGTEFWRDLQPIKQVFRPGAVPEAYVPNIATHDERYYAPLSETVGTRPVFISLGQNRWCDGPCAGAPGESHTLVAYESDEPMKVTFNVTGPLMWLDEKGEPCGTFDVFDYIEVGKAHYEKVGIGAGYIDRLMR